MHILKPLPGTLPMPGRPLADAFALWLMNSLDNRIFDWSGNNRNGTFGVGAASPSWTLDKFGFATSYDGGDHVNCGNIQTDFDGVTIIVGVKFNDVTWGIDPNGNSIIGKGYDGATLPLRLGGQNGNLQWGFYDGDWNNLVSYPEGNFSIGIPYQIAGTISSTDMILYVDGRQVANLGLAPDNMITNNKNLLIGAYDKIGVLQNFHDGQIEYIHFFNYPFPDSKIALARREPFCMFPEPIMPEFGIAA